MLEESPVIALTIGDPAGIGPEITADLIGSGGLDGVRACVIGSAPRLLECLGPEAPDDSRIIPVDNLEKESDFLFPAIIDTSAGRRAPSGIPSETGGRISGTAVETAISMARGQIVDAIVTGPVSKEALSLAGYPYRGHTDMLADRFESPDCQMMMVNGDLRIVIMTRDIPLKDVPAAVTKSGLMRCVEVTLAALGEYWGLEEARIAVAALNPHAGDGGVTGTEERDIIVPAIEALSRRGVRVEGPVPSDTLFCDWKSKPYHAYIALYHDQGMIPFKSAGFYRGVNMTIGIPVVRTSVCHGTAYSLAGKGLAKAGSLKAALALAVRCGARAKKRAGLKR